MKESQMVAKVIGAKEVPTNSLVPNPHNPRLLFDRDPMEALKASIAKVGILVPLTVYRDSKSGNYVILDGQRRWTCASQLNIPRVTINEVSEPTLVQNIVTMFKIHKLREDWELMPTALKLELLMNELNERNVARIAAVTDLSESVVTRCKKLLTYPKRFQDLMLDPDPKQRVKSDFFIELYQIAHDREVARMNWFSRQKFTEQMLSKYGPDKSIKSVTDFRLIKQYINNAKRSGKLQEMTQRFKEFAEQESVPISHLNFESAQTELAARNRINQVKDLSEMVKHLDVEKFIGEERLWVGLIELYKAIEAKLKEADRRF